MVHEGSVLLAHDFINAHVFLMLFLYSTLEEKKLESCGQPIFYFSLLRGRQSLVHSSESVFFCRRAFRRRDGHFRWHASPQIPNPTETPVGTLPEPLADAPPKQRNA